MARPRTNEPEDLNLIPLMNLFVTMIPLLLLTAAFYHIGMVSVSVPTQGTPDESSVETSKRAVTVSVRMTKRGYSVTASNDTLSEQELKALDAFVPKTAGKYDNKMLTAVLERIKRKYNESDTMMLVPTKQVKYDDMVKAMDAARNMIVPFKGRKRKIGLFPVVVVTTMVQ